MKRKEQELAALRSGERPCGRSGQYWSKEEREKAICSFETGVGLSDLALELNRTELAVVQELKKAGAFENQTRRRDRNQPKYQDGKDRCRCPNCLTFDCPNHGKEFYDARTA